MSDKLPPKILVIESDEILSASVCNTVERYWFNVIRANNAEVALKAAASNQLNIIIISSRLTDMSAIEMAAKLRKFPQFLKTPLIFLADESESIANYKIFDNNLVEVLQRPFTSGELMSAVRSLLRKSQPVFQDKLIKYKDISIDLSTYKVHRAGKSIHLGPTEFKILQLFMQSPKTIFLRQQIIEYVWGSDNKIIKPRTVDVHVNRLRTLMSMGTKNDHFIKTVRSSGYCLNLPGEID